MHETTPSGIVMLDFQENGFAVNVCAINETAMQVWKKGTYMRVDGSLMGIDDKAGTLIPTWKRGHFSLLFDGAQKPASLLLVDHKKQTVVDLTKEKKKHKPDIDEEVLPLLHVRQHLPQVQRQILRGTKAEEVMCPVHHGHTLAALASVVLLPAPAKCLVL